ncbi:hypothetical protein PsorP6_014807 [Peronosclerospora sorghi]|uniref:Uncharacterized protein n=1 Tax=Peronosclerospora sorghi TaxID=230839 RepID=A0ACC0VUM3_9STRA|nr:hypothetical protein PsorP6_014807 [Peronosclerospora sorghi]
MAKANVKMICRALANCKRNELAEIEGQAGNQARAKNRTINHITLGFIAYFAVASGPFGVEDAIRAPGPDPVLLVVLLQPITWGLPQALMTAELSKRMDENGGYILWVRRRLSGTGRWLVKCLALLLVFISNAVGMRAVAMASVFMSLFVLSPFVLDPPSIETFNLATWGSIAPEIGW